MHEVEDHEEAKLLTLAAYLPSLTLEQTRIERMELALKQIAAGETDSLSGDPTKWPCVVARVGLGLPPRE